LLRSANAPVVSNFNLQNGFQWGSPKQPIELTWDGSDDDNDPLTYRVIAVRETTEFNILVSDITETSYFVDPAMMPGGGNYDIFIEATDGFDSGFSTIATGWVEPLPPQPIITYPREGDEVLASTPLKACALYADFQGEAPQIPMQWSLDNVTIAEGDKLTLTQLGLGPHTLEITAINDFQKVGSYSVNFMVIDKISPPVLVSPSDGSTGEPLPPMLDWDPVNAADGYQLQVALDAAFTQLIVDDASIFDTQFEFAAAFTAVNYHWRVQALVDGDGSGWSTEWTFLSDGFPVGNEPIAARVPLNLRVFPNPFNPSTSISYSMAHGGPVQLVIYDLAGRRVRTLVQETRPSGEHTARWNGQDDSGQIVASGVYLARIQALGLEDTQRLVLLK